LHIHFIPKGNAMDRRDERPVSALKQDAERTRVELTDTVDHLRSKVAETVTDLRERASPDALRAEASEYFRTRADRLMEKARENPLQAAAIGVSLAYPLFGIVRSIPAPVLMIGAGLFLLGSSSGQRASRQIAGVANDLSGQAAARVDAMSRNVRDAQERAAGGIASVGRSVSSGVDGVKQQASLASAAMAQATSQVRDRAVEIANVVSDGLGILTEKGSTTANSASDTMRDSAAATGSAIRHAAGAAAGFGTDATAQLRDRAVETSQRAASLIAETIQNNPLLTGGIGLAIGALIASTLPRSDIEQGVIGGLSADMQRRAKNIAADGYESVKGFAEGVSSDVAHSAEKEGLTADDFNEAATDLGRRVRKVAENAATTAFELPDENSSNAADRRSVS
jgi:ElaB/YqjD/DUF883 family membrane-anchored ribosome-binding protein